MKNISNDFSVFNDFNATIYTVLLLLCVDTDTVRVEKTTLWKTGGKWWSIGCNWISGSHTQSVRSPCMLKSLGGSMRNQDPFWTDGNQKNWPGTGRFLHSMEWKLKRKLCWLHYFFLFVPWGMAGRASKLRPAPKEWMFKQDVRKIRWLPPWELLDDWNDKRINDWPWVRHLSLTSWYEPAGTGSWHISSFPG